MNSRTFLCFSLFCTKEPGPISVPKRFFLLIFRGKVLKVHWEYESIPFIGYTHKRVCICACVSASGLDDEIYVVWSVVIKNWHSPE